MVEKRPFIHFNEGAPLFPEKLVLTLHQAKPIAVAQHCHHGVETIERRRKRNAFIHVQAGANGIHHQP